jgi:hypothetical protein
VKHHHPSEENMTGHVTASPNVKPIPIAAMDSSEESPSTELANRARTLADYTARQQRFEHEARARDFASEIKTGEEHGLRFEKEPGPGGQYRVAESRVVPSPVRMGHLHRLAVAAASVGEVQIVADVVRIAKDLKPDWDDPNYPTWKHIYEAAYKWLDPNSPAAIALKKVFGGA